MSGSGTGRLRRVLVDRLWTRNDASDVGIDAGFGGSAVLPFIATLLALQFLLLTPLQPLLFLIPLVDGSPQWRSFALRSKLDPSRTRRASRGLPRYARSGGSSGAGAPRPSQKPPPGRPGGGRGGRGPRAPRRAPTLRAVGRR